MSSLTETRMGGRYVLQQKLGEGGMGIVYRAIDRLTQATVALKQVTIPTNRLEFSSRASMGKSDSFRLALAREFKTLASLRHPHIISVLDYGFNEHRRPFLTMELLENAPTLIEAGRDQPRPQQIELLVQVLQALAYLHRRGIIHRDLKPDNVLVIDGQVRVLDFGLAVAREHLTAENRHIYGTPAYMAPEILEGQPASEASDLYAVGIMAYELFAGRHPFDTANFGLLTVDILKKAPDTRALGLDASLASILDRLLAKSPAERYSRARDLINLYAEAIERPELIVETRAIRESFLQAARFVGREAEVEQLGDALAAARVGRGSAWLVGGESGVGKSRLLDEFRPQVLVEGVLVFQGQAISEGRVPYQVWREVLRQLCLESELSDLEAGVLKTLVPDIGRLLEREVPDAPEVAAQVAYERLLQVIAAVVRRRTQPLVIILEDLQWVGDESVAVLERLTQDIANVPLLLLASYRDDERPRLPQELPQMQQLNLSRLTAASIATLSESMLGVAGRQPELVNLLQQQTEGNTFFIVEVVRALAEEAGRLGQIAKMSLPRTVLAGGMQAVIKRRLQRVPRSAYSLLQAAAVAGRQIDPGSLQGVDAAVNVEAWLNTCTEARVLEVQEGRWQFAHDKLREGLLLNLPAAEQRVLHRQVAEAIEQVYADDLSSFYPRLAHHWSRVVEEEQPDPVLVLKAIDYLQKAGEQAVRSSAAQEAVDLFSQAMALLKALPDNPERIQQEFVLQIPLAVALMNLKGYGDPEVGQAFTRAHELYEQVGTTPQLYPVVHGLWAFYFVGADYEPAIALADQTLRLARKAVDPTIVLVAGHHAQTANYYMLGQVNRSLDHAEQVFVNYDRLKDRSLVYQVGQDPKATCLSWAGLALWKLGYPDQGRERLSKARTLARELDHPYTLCFALWYTSMFHQYCRDAQATQEAADDDARLSTEHGFSLFFGPMMVMRGWALAEQGRAAAEIAEMHQGRAMSRTIGLQVFQPYFRALLAEVQSKAGLIKEGLATLSEALAQVEKTGECHYEAELYRLKGELLLQRGDDVEGEGCFQKAIEIARRQGAKSLELRAVMSLSRLWQKRGQGQAARQALEEIYGWFTEGFDTADLQEARVLLEELS